MPWLWLSIKMHPHNIETYLVTSFWLANAANQPDLALEVLQEAQLNNPYNYQVQIEKGRIYLKQGKLQEAKHAFDAALSFWNKTADQLNEYENMDRAEALLYRGLLAEHENDTDLAVRLYEEILKHFPTRSGIKHRITAIENGNKPDIDASLLWNKTLKATIKEKSKCHHEDAHEGKHEDE
jgi:tetratricopeptide (TPR) repeat protein